MLNLSWNNWIALYTFNTKRVAVISCLIIDRYSVNIPINYKGSCLIVWILGIDTFFKYC